MLLSTDILQSHTYNHGVIGGEAQWVVPPFPARLDPGPGEHGQAEGGRVPIFVPRRRRRYQVRHFARHVFTDRPTHVVDQCYQVRLDQKTIVV